MLRLGIISELGTGENAGFARVSFDDTGIVSGWLSLPAAQTRTAKHWQPVEVNTQVACLMDEACEQGAIVIALWSFTDTPPEWATADTTGIQYADGTQVYYDVAKKQLIVNAPDAELKITCKSLDITGAVNIDGDTRIKGETRIDGDTSVTGEVSATKEVTAGAMKIKLTQHKHPTPAGVSGTPTP